MTTATCDTCDFRDTSPNADRAAEKHTKATKHGTNVRWRDEWESEK